MDAQSDSYFELKLFIHGGAFFAEVDVNVDVHDVVHSGSVGHGECHNWRDTAGTGPVQCLDSIVSY
jgi:hypothetical protein